MHIKINRNELLKAISIIEKALSSKTVIESLKGIKIEAKNDQLIFTTSKQDLAIQYIVKENLNIMTEGTSILPGTYLVNIVKSTMENEFEFIKENDTTILKTPKSKIKLVEYDITSYPNISFTHNDNSILLNTTILKEAFNKTQFCVATNNIKPILAGVNFKFDNGRLNVVSTDARRLAITNYEIESSVNSEFTLDKFIYSDIVKILEITNDSAIKIYNTGNQLIIETDAVLIKSRIIEGEYPNIERLIPTTSTFNYEINSQELVQVLKKILLLSDRENGNVTINVEDNKIKLKSILKELGAFEELCELENLEGSPFAISFDPKFLIDAINSIDSENLKLQFVDEISAFLVKNTIEDGVIQVISPIRMA